MPEWWDWVGRATVRKSGSRAARRAGASPGRSDRRGSRSGSAQHSGDRVEQSTRIGWFRNDRREQRPVLRRGRRRRGQRDDWHGRRTCLSFDLSHDVQCRVPRHDHVDQHQRRTRRGENVQCLGSTVRFQYLVGMRPQKSPEAAADARVVIDEKDGRAQGRGHIIRAEAVNLVETNDNECEPRRTSEAIHSATPMLRPSSHCQRRGDRLMLRCRGVVMHVHETNSGGTAYQLAY